MRQTRTALFWCCIGYVIAAAIMFVAHNERPSPTGHYDAKCQPEMLDQPTALGWAGMFAILFTGAGLCYAIAPREWKR